MQPSKKSYKEQEKEKQRGKRKYLERLQETKEAEDAIQEFIPEQLEFPEPPNINELDW